MQEEWAAVLVAKAVVRRAGVEDQHITGLGHRQHAVERHCGDIGHEESHSRGVDVVDGGGDLVRRGHPPFIETEGLVQELAGRVVVDDAQPRTLHPLVGRRRQRLDGTGGDLRIGLAEIGDADLLSGRGFGRRLTAAEKQGEKRVRQIRTVVLLRAATACGRATIVE